MCMFLLDILLKHRTSLSASLLMFLQAGQSLSKYWAVMAREPRKRSVVSQQELFQYCLDHIFHYGSAGGHYVPKHHSFLHMSHSTDINGNPPFFSTYEDEHENGVVAGIGCKVHPNVFCLSVFERLFVLDELESDEDCA